MNTIVLSATWCSNCTTLKKQLDAMNVQYSIIDVDKNPEFAQKVKARSLPTTVLMKDDEVIQTFVGLKSQEIFKAVNQ
jgi:thioredoxin-like negative regulator of GroEL